MASVLGNVWDVGRRRGNINSFVKNRLPEKSLNLATIHHRPRRSLCRFFLTVEYIFFSRHKRGIRFANIIGYVFQALLLLRTGYPEGHILNLRMFTCTKINNFEFLHFCYLQPDVRFMDFSFLSP